MTRLEAHPGGCWQLTGHERCALRYAADRAANAAAQAAGAAKLFRAALSTTESPSADVLAAALTQLSQRPVEPVSDRQHMRGQDHPCATLTDAQVAEIRATYRRNVRGEVARFTQHYRISRSLLFSILRGDRRAAA